MREFTRAHIFRVCKFAKGEEECSYLQSDKGKIICTKNLPNKPLIEGKTIINCNGRTGEFQLPVIGSGL